MSPPISHFTEEKTPHKVKEKYVNTITVGNKVHAGMQRTAGLLLTPRVKYKPAEEAQ